MDLSEPIALRFKANTVKYVFSIRSLCAAPRFQHSEQMRIFDSQPSGENTGFVGSHDYADRNGRLLFSHSEPVTGMVVFIVPVDANPNVAARQCFDGDSALMQQCKDCLLHDGSVKT